MAGTVFVRDIVGRVSSLMQDNAPQFTRWQEYDIINALNDAQTAIASFLPAACSDVLSLKLKTGTLQSIDTMPTTAVKYQDGSAPAATVYGTSLLSLICNMGSDGLTVGQAIRMVKRGLLDLHSPMWHTLTGGVVREYVFDPETPQIFYVVPGVSSVSTVWIRAAVTLVPKRVPDGVHYGSTPLYDALGAGSGSGVTISIDDEYVDPIVNYVVARLNLMDQEMSNANKAATFSAAFVGWLNAKVKAMTGSNPNLKSLPFAPEPGARAS